MSLAPPAGEASPAWLVTETEQTAVLVDADIYYASFCRAAQRAVCESPQSVEETSLSGGAKRRKWRTRAAITSGLSSA